MGINFSFRRHAFLVGVALLHMGGVTIAQHRNPNMFNCMKWRNIGPFRGGRTVGASGDLQHPNIFYIGVNNGGVWKTTDYGRTWNPIFDDQPTGSIGDVAVAPTNANTIYVASGEGLQRPDLSVGDGMYKSTDAGKTWKNIGLREGLQIGGIAISPVNENTAFAAVLGHPYGPNKERGVYRTTDGGKTWKQVLYTDENTGAVQVTIDPADPKTIYADMWAARLAPWENGMWAGPGSGLYKSTDGGDTWHPLKNGLPDRSKGLGRIGFCVAPSQHNRLYAVVNASEEYGGIYRSDDAGEHWNKINNDKRLWDRGDDFAEIKADPKNADIVYNANVVTWKSTDGGKSWNAFKGAPGGDDYHRLWINPANTDVILLASDQGAGITVNAGQTWSSWYNQPTAQLYHVSADNAFPYNLYSGQQESGSVGISSRGNDGAITFRDWKPVGAEEYGYVVADPKDPNIVYGGKISRHDKRTGQTQHIAPAPPAGVAYRFLRTAPVVFSPIDSVTLFYAGNMVFKTRNGGQSWQVISPDLTRETYDVPDCIGVYKTEDMKAMPRRGVVYTLAPSAVDSNTLWAGTDDGLIHLTQNGGKTWQNVTPPALTSWSKVSLMDAGNTDKNTAYAAVNRIRLDDYKPHIYRTRDAGKTWQEIVRGLPNDPINVVKEDPLQKGLLFAGSERAVYVSFDDGDHWQSLRLNMPATSIRDLVIKDDDIAVATHGRSFWILDNITALRQLATHPAAAVTLYRPQLARRVRWNMYSDTPMPQDEPVGENPPDGAIIDYYLANNTAGEVTLTITDKNGKTVRRYSSADTLYTIPNVNIPLYWVRPQQKLSGTAGAHRFVWDMHYQPLNVPPAYPISAIYGNTAPAATSPWVMPGDYTVSLTVNGHTYAQPLTIAMDPRVKTPRQDLQLQHDLSFSCYTAQRKLAKIERETISILSQLSAIPSTSPEPLYAAAAELKQQLTWLTEGAESCGAVSKTLGRLSDALQSADVAPTMQQQNGITLTLQRYDGITNKWASVQQQLPILNKQLTQAGRKPIKYKAN